MKLSTDAADDQRTECGSLAIGILSIIKDAFKLDKKAIETKQECYSVLSIKIRLLKFAFCYRTVKEE